MEDVHEQQQPECALEQLKNGSETGGRARACAGGLRSSVLGQCRLEAEHETDWQPAADHVAPEPLDQEHEQWPTREEQFSLAHERLGEIPEQHGMCEGKMEEGRKMVDRSDWLHSFESGI